MGGGWYRGWKGKRIGGVEGSGEGNVGGGNGTIRFFFQAEDGIRDLVRSRGLGDVYKRQQHNLTSKVAGGSFLERPHRLTADVAQSDLPKPRDCLLYTSDAADDLPCVDLGGRRRIKKKTKTNNTPP